MKSKKNSNLSGISIALAFAALGLVYAYWLSNVYGVGTKYVAGLFIFIGGVGLLVELSNALKNSRWRLDNGGIGLVLLVPSAIGAYYANLYTDGLLRGGLIFIISCVAIFGLAGLIDVFVSIIEDVKVSRNFRKNITSVMKLLVLLISSSATIVVALRQILL